MKKLKWIALILVILLLCAGVTSWLLARSWVAKNLTSDAVISRIEREWNCRAQVESIEANLFSSPASIHIKELIILPRDAEVNKPLSSRPVVKSGAAVALHNIYLQLDTWALLLGRLHVEEFSIVAAEILEEVNLEGESRLQTLFSKPKLDYFTSELNKLKLEQSGSPDPGKSSKLPSAIPTSLQIAGNSSAPPSTDTRADTINLPLGLEVDSFSLSKVVFHLNNRRAKTRTALRDLSLSITDADIDTSDLTNHNQCKVSLTAKVETSNRIKVNEVMQEVKMAQFDISSRGVVRPFDANNKKLSPDASVVIEVKKGSVFGGALTFGTAFGKDKNVASLKDKFGLDITDLTVGGPLQEDLVADVRIQEGRCVFIKDASLAFPHYAVALKSGSWINGPEDLHEAHVGLLPGDELSKRISDAVAAKLGTGFAPLVLGIVKDDKGRVFIEFISSERLSKPRFELDGKLKALEDLGKNLGGGLLKGLLGQ